MPTWQVDLSDGRTVDVESDTEPTEDELFSSLSSWQEPEAEQPQAQPVSLMPPSGFGEFVPRGSEELAASNFQRTQELSRAFPGFSGAQEYAPISEGITSALSVSPQTVQNAGEVVRAAGIARNLQAMGIPVSVDKVMADVAGQREIAPGKRAQVAAGLQNVGAGIAGSFTDPLNAAAMASGMAIPALAPAISGAFALHMGSTIGEQARAAGEASVTGTPFEKTTAFGNLATTAAFVPGLAAHAVRPLIPKRLLTKPVAASDTQLQLGVPREGISAKVEPNTKLADVDSSLTVEPAKVAGPEFIKSESTVDRNAAQDKLAAETDLSVLEKQAAEATTEAKTMMEELGKSAPTEASMQAFQDASAKVQFLNEAIRKKKEAKTNIPTQEANVPTPQAAKPDAVNNLVPAVKYKGETHIGQPGETHAKLINRVFANDPEAKFELQNMTQESEAARGFATEGTTEFIDRNTSAEMVGMKPENGKRPVLYSEWLNELRSRQAKSATEPTSASASQGAPPSPAEQPASPLVEGTPAAGAAVESAAGKAEMVKAESPDWTSATEEIDTPAPSRASEPSGLAVVEMGAGIPIPKFADRKMSPLDKVTTSHSGKLQKSFSEARLAQNEIKKAVPSERRQSAISIWREANGDIPTLQAWAAAAKGKLFKQAATEAQSLTAKEIAIANKAIAAFTALEGRGNTFDVLRSHRENYVPHVWDVKRPGTGFGTGMLKERFRFSKARTFNTFFEGDQAGFKPKTLAIGKLLPAYLHEMNKVISDRQMVRDLAKGTMPDGSPMVSPRGNSKVVDGPGGKAVLVSPKAMREADVSDYKTMSDQPALSNWTWEGKDTDGKPVFVKADLALHPDVYRRVNAMIGQSALRNWYHDPVSGTAQIPRAIMRGLDTAQSAMKREMFGLLAPFHQVQEGTHAIGHLVNPFFGLEKVDLVKNPKQVDAANHGLMLLPDRASARVYLEGVGTQSSLLSQGLRKTGKATAGVGEAIADVIDGYQDYLFHQYIPSLKFKTYEAMVDRNTKLYAKELASGEMSPADVKLTSAEQANAAYGHLNYALLDRNPTIQHMIQLAALAPDFLEARVRFAGQGVKGLRSKVGHEQLKAIAILAAAQAGTALVLSQLLGVPWDEEHPFEVVYGGRRYAMRSVPEDIFGLMKDTRQFVYSRVNPLTVKGSVQLATGLNYRGEKVTPTETMTELLAGYIPITARAIPAVRSLTETGRKSPVTPLQQLAGSLGLRISRYSPISETYNLAGEWMDKQKIARDRGSYPVSKYQQLRYALEDGDLERAKTEYETLKKDTPAKKIRDGFKQSIDHPFTGSDANDKKFSKTLTGYDKELYEQALRSRKNILKAFKSL